MLVNGQQLAWLLTSLSNILWLFVFVPQLYRNYKNQNVDAISLMLLFFLVLGDVFSVMGAIMKNLNVILVYSAVYHIILDVVIIYQIMYYRRKNFLIDREMINERSYLLNPITEFPKYVFFYFTYIECIFMIISSIVLLGCVTFSYMNGNINTSILFGDIIGWLATGIFIVARIPQIMLNYKRESVEGLSLLSFIIITMANILFFSSILIILYDLNVNEHMNYIKDNIQWLAGSGLSSVFDCIIFYQFYKYKLN